MKRSRGVLKCDNPHDAFLDSMSRPHEAEDYGTGAAGWRNGGRSCCGYSWGGGAVVNSQPERNGIVDAMGGVLILFGSGNSVNIGAKYVKGCWSFHRQKGSGRQPGRPVPCLPASVNSGISLSAAASLLTWAALRASFGSSPGNL